MSESKQPKKDANGAVLQFTEKDQKAANEQYLKAKKKHNSEVISNLKTEAKKQADAKKKAQPKKGKQVELTATENLSGKYGLPYSKGQTFKINEKKGAELLKNKDAEKPSKK